jgi:tetratricopeptide (TPR) repeat protein
MNNLGNVYCDLGDKSKAKDFYENALEIFTKTLPDDHASIAHTFYKLGLVYSDLGDNCKAKGFYEKALEIDRKTFHENHPYIKDILRELNNLK